MNTHSPSPQNAGPSGTLERAVLHEFNNIVGSIMGNAEVADLELDADHPAKVAISEVIKASKRARELLRTIKVRDSQAPLQPPPAG